MIVMHINLTSSLLLLDLQIKDIEKNKC